MIFDPFRWFVITIIGLLIGTMLTGCSVKASPPDREFIPEVSATQEAEPRGSVYVYGQARVTDPQQIILRLNGEPLLLPSGYARVVGVVSGVSPVACLEIGGRGLALGEGDRLDDYQVSEILEQSIVLQKEQ